MLCANTQEIESHVRKPVEELEYMHITLSWCVPLYWGEPQRCALGPIMFERHTYFVSALSSITAVLMAPSDLSFFYLPYCHLEVAQINTCIKNTWVMSLTQLWFLSLCCFSHRTWLFYCAVAMQQCCSGTAVWISNLLVTGCHVWRWRHIMFVLNLFLMHLNTQHKTALGLRISLNNN